MYLDQHRTNVPLIHSFYFILCSRAKGGPGPNPNSNSVQSESSSLITVRELTSLGLVVAIFSEETHKRSGRQSAGDETFAV